MNYREISPSKGYLLDGTTYKVVAEDKFYAVEYNHTANEVVEQVNQGKYRNFQAHRDGETQIETPEADETFEVSQYRRQL